MGYHLRITEYENENRWRWVLEDERGAFLADHEVDLGAAEERESREFQDLPGSLWRYRDIRKPETMLARLGAWMGTEIFGAVGEALARNLSAPATVVRVSIPAAAQGLLTRPFELAHLPTEKGDRPMVEAGVRLVYHLEDAPDPGASKAVRDVFRVLAVFSLPHGENPLSLRRERVELERLVRRFAQTGNRAVELRVLQYGATRTTLREALEEAAGWDLIHISGHGLKGELVLEDETGASDRIDDEAVGRIWAGERDPEVLTGNVDPNSAQLIRRILELI